MVKEFKKFINGKNLLQIWSGRKIVFESNKRGIDGPSEFIRKYNKRFADLIIFDTKVGNAAALLFAYLGAKEVYSLVGSEAAKKTLESFKIKFHFEKTIPNILNRDETDICPLEKLSFGKAPREFYEVLTA